MKQRFLFFFILTICNLTSWGQVSIIIDSIILDNVIEAKDTSLHISHWGGGPNATIRVSITNSSQREIKICQHEDYELYCTFEYNGVSHKTLDIYLSIDENNPLVIPPDSTYNEILSTGLFLPYSVIEMTDGVVYDHSLVLNEVITSFKVVLRIDGEYYLSNDNPTIIRGDYFYYEHKWEDN